MLTATQIALVVMSLVAVIGFSLMAIYTKKPQTKGLLGVFAVVGVMVIAGIVVPVYFIPSEEVAPPLDITGKANWVNVDLTENTTFIEEGDDDGTTIFFDVPAVFNQTSNLFESSTGVITVYLKFENKALNDGSTVNAEVTQVGEWVDESGTSDQGYYIIKRMGGDFLFNWTESGSTITSELLGPAIPNNVDDSDGWIIVSFELNPNTFDLMSEGDNADSHTIIQFTNSLTGDLIRELVFDIELDDATS